ncbi:MAG: phosphopantetheine-binding protein [Gemmatimonadota bacterium]
MSKDEIRSTLLSLLSRIAPEADLTSLRGDISLRAQLDIDSIDFLNFVIEVHKTLGVDVPESDYNALGTLDGAVAYLEPRATKVEA